MRSAIERSIEIISEATRRIPDAEKAKHPNIPWDDIADIGNYLRHQYHDLNDRILWNVTQGPYLDDLRAAVDSMDPNLVLARRMRRPADD